MCGSIIKKYGNFGFFSVSYIVKKQRESSVRTSSFEMITVSDNPARQFKLGRGIDCKST
jgi:hypothetical protein